MNPVVFLLLFGGFNGGYTSSYSRDDDYIDVPKWLIVEHDAAICDNVLDPEGLLNDAAKGWLTANDPKAQIERLGTKTKITFSSSKLRYKFAEHWG